MSLVAPLIPSEVRDAALTATHWPARLALGFALRAGRTTLVDRAHSGPLVVQKSLYPEGPEVCQCVIVHPPGGIVGGDTLALQVEVAKDARAQLVTPGAAKWYRTAGGDARQALDFRVDHGGSLEWLPNESIVFDGAEARMQTRVALSGSAVLLFWDVVCLGRTAAGERFTRGSLQQGIEVVRDGALIWVERAVLHAGDLASRSAAGFGNRAAYGTFVIAAPSIEDDWLGAARTHGSNIAEDDYGATRLPGVLIVRCRADAADHIHARFRALWMDLRPRVIGRSAVLPRIWRT